MSKFSVNERADRWQRRFTGPWQTTSRELGSVSVSWRYRRRPKIEYVRFWIASHDLRREMERALLPPMRWLARRPDKEAE